MAKKVLTIAGSDSGGGAGIQADLKTFTALGVYGMSVISALTAQNTLGVEGIESVSPSFIKLQLDAVLKDIGADAVKTGMLYSADIIQTVADALCEYKLKNVVVDPVMVSTSGSILLASDALETMKKSLLPKALIVTPNAPEAAALSGMPVETLEDVRRAAVEIKKLGSQYVLIKGGHLPPRQHELDGGLVVVDTLYDGSQFWEFEGTYLSTNNTHGTGCTLAAAIASYLSQGHEVCEAIERAKKYLAGAMAHGYQVGKGKGVLNHYHNFKHVDNYLPLIDSLKASCADDWSQYIHHPFVKGIQSGTLPLESFKHYIRQDYIFLNHFARANALAIYKCDNNDGSNESDLLEMREASMSIADIINVETELHIKYCESFGISLKELLSTPESKANMAYTRFVLEKGLSGDLLDLRVAMAACIVGYGDIGMHLYNDNSTKKDGNPYYKWIEMYSSELYQDAVRRAKEQLNRLSTQRGINQQRISGLSKIFKQGVQLEIGFWDMGLACTF